MFHVKQMCVADFPFATKLANTMNWNMALEDFEFMTMLEPDGCFVVFQGSERLGIATSISFGDVGWFGNLIVKEKRRSKGAGSLLVSHAINYLQDKGVKTIGLYAYPNLVHFYGDLGFTQDEDFSVFHAEDLASLRDATLPKVKAPQIRKIEEFDSLCFGGNRKKLLEPIILEKNNLSYYKSEGPEIIGYVVSTVYETMAWLGPLICKSSDVDVAISLIKTVLAKLTGLSVYAVLPKRETALSNVLLGAGFKEEFSTVRMFLGKSVAKNCIYLAESLERG